jgi:hypothetical protein
MREKEPSVTLTSLTTTARPAPRELAYRTTDGLEVTLLWEPGSDLLTVCVCDHRRGAYFEVHPDPRLALDAFYHPYSYEPSSAVHFEDDRLAA